MKRLSSIVLTLAAAIAMVYGPAPVSAATIQAWQCEQFRFCTYEHSDGEGFLIDVGDRTFINFGGAGIGDKVSSVRNNTSKPGVLYDWNAGGQCWVVIYITGIGSKNVPSDVNDRADALSLGKAPIVGRLC